jgi:exodeoxyribonuclease V alpha subunit
MPSQPPPPVSVILLAPERRVRLRGLPGRAGRGFLDGDQLRSVSVGRLAYVETAFAMTVQKSQGSEFGHVVLVLPDEDVPLLTRELVYTGIARASRAFALVAKQAGLLASATGRLTRRVSAA